MHTYRVLMQDKHNGETFHFAINVMASDPTPARLRAAAEFPECAVIGTPMRTFTFDGFEGL